MASPHDLVMARREPWQRVVGLAVRAQVDIEARLAVIRLAHDADGLAGEQPLADGAVHPDEPGQKRMISAAMLDYQDMPVPADRPGENDSHVLRRHDLRTVPGLEGYSLDRQSVV